MIIVESVSMIVSRVIGRKLFFARSIRASEQWCKLAFFMGFRASLTAHLYRSRSINAVLVNTKQIVSEKSCADFYNYSKGKQVS